MPTIICARPPWLMIRLRRRSTIPSAPASDAAALVYMSTGTMERTRSTQAISEKRTGSSFSPWADQRPRGDGDEPEGYLFALDHRRQRPGRRDLSSICAQQGPTAGLLISTD